MDAFAKFVCGAHSSYKHLPYYPPGKPLLFFVDPAAGMDLTFHTDRVEATPRLERGFHYSWIPTHEYREKFGHLAFSRTSGTTVYRVAADCTVLAPGDDVPAIYDPVARSLRRLPAEVVAAGVALVSGIVHPDSTDPQLVLQFANERARAAWPEESGGRQGRGSDLDPVDALGQARRERGRVPGQRSHVNIVGRLRNNNYENAQGETVYGLAFICEEIDYLDSKAESEARRAKQEGASAPQGTPPAVTADKGPARTRQTGKAAKASRATDEDVPF